jgi:hypothetical protein
MDSLQQAKVIMAMTELHRQLSQTIAQASQTRMELFNLITYIDMQGRPKEPKALERESIANEILSTRHYPPNSLN